MRRTVLFALALVALGLPEAARAASPRQVDRAIRRAKEYLYSVQKNGNWEEVQQPAADRRKHADVTADQWGGLTAIATYALLAMGDDPQKEPRLKAPVDFLMKADVIGTYALGMRAQVWNKLRTTDAIKAAAKKDRELLLNLLKQPGPNDKNQDARGMYNYQGFPDDRYDHSCSNYGVLGMWACAQVLGEVPPKYWQEVDAAWKRHQNADGGWGYTKGTGSTISLTPAGVATLFITQDYLNQGRAANCGGNLRDPAIDRGVEWLAKNIAKGFGNWPYYALYNIERVGKAGGYKYFGDVNWFEVGVETLVRQQGPNGAWGQGGGRRADIYDTCFALLFLSRGREPVMLSKLRYEIDRKGDKPLEANWNQRHRDAANIVAWVGKGLERDLNWQIVHLDAPVGELLEAPLLYIAGNQNLAFKPEHETKLRQYVERGGLILAHQDCPQPVGPGGQFADSILKLGQKLFRASEFRELPADHAIYRHQQFPRAAWRNPPSVLGLSNGARELILLIPKADAAREWQMQNVGAKRELHELIANVFLYTVSQKNLRYKGETYLVEASPRVKAKHSIRVARLEYAGPWDPEPAGWTRLGNIMHNTLGVDLAVETVKLGDGKLDPKAFKVAHLTGTAKFALTAPQRNEIKQFLAGGGTLIADATGGATEFAISLEQEIKNILPDAQLPVPVLNPRHDALAGPNPIKTVDYRPHARRVLGRLNVARIRGLDLGGRTAIFMSPDDLSVGLMGSPVDGIVGYQPDDAAAIMSNLLVHAAQVPLTDEYIAEIQDMQNPNAPEPKIAEQFAKFAPDWRLAQCIRGHMTGMGKAPGDRPVFWTHPVDDETPAILRTFAAIPAGAKASLQLTVGCNKDGDWQLIVRGNDQELLRKTIDSKVGKDGFVDLSIDLAQFAGGKLRLELINQATGWNNEWAAWVKLALVVAPTTGPATGTGQPSTSGPASSPLR
jgi:hypothetical protein